MGFVADAPRFTRQHCFFYFYIDLPVDRGDLHDQTTSGKTRGGVKKCLKKESRHFLPAKILALMPASASACAGNICTNDGCTTSTLQSVRVMLAIAAEVDYRIYNLDVRTGFVSADLEEEVSLSMPPRLRAQQQRKCLLSRET